MVDKYIFEVFGQYFHSMLLYVKYISFSQFFLNMYVFFKLKYLGRFSYLSFLSLFITQLHWFVNSLFWYFILWCIVFWCFGRGSDFYIYGFCDALCKLNSCLCWTRAFWEVDQPSSLSPPIFHGRKGRLLSLSWSELNLKSGWYNNTVESFGHSNDLWVWKWGKELLTLV
jgi:hypothetical protein